jgi:hypothetical protein
MSEPYPVTVTVSTIESRLAIATRKESESWLNDSNMIND